MSKKIKPFLKWIGGKKRLIPQIAPLLPKKIDHYFEPFLGGGAMFFYIKKNYNPKYCYLSDLNEDLINTYIDVRDNPKEIIKKFKYFKRNHSKEYYYKIRQEFNDKKIKGIRRSTAFIYLNKSCFNGIFRVNKKGEFNVPFSGRDSPFFSEEDLLIASNLLQGVILKCHDYQKILSKLKKEDFIYLDPCYDPLNPISFVKYTTKKYNINDRIILLKFIKKANKKAVNIMLSNNDIKEIRTIYEPENFNLQIINASRCVNSNGAKRGKIKELLITNY